MKTLTIITTLFMPISFIASFFGMNFFQPVARLLDPWTSLPSFIVTMVIIMLTPVGMLTWMRSRGWMFNDSNSRRESQNRRQKFMKRRVE
jgi:magnesium transporter